MPNKKEKPYPYEFKESAVKLAIESTNTNTNTDTVMLMFNMMGSIAEFERTLINRRIYDGVKRAKSLGKYKGRKHSADEDIRKGYIEMLQSGQYTASYIARMAKVSRQTLYNWKIDFETAE